MPSKMNDLQLATAVLCKGDLNPGLDVRAGGLNLHSPLLAVPQDHSAFRARRRSSHS